MSDLTLEVNEADFQTQVLESPIPVLVDFWAEWCGPCKMLAPIVDEIAAEYGDKLRVVKVDADANPAVLQRYGIMGIPTLLLFKGGRDVERITGFKPKDKILSKLEPHLS